MSIINITEQDYLELAKEAKEKYEELEDKINKKNEELNDIKRELISCYGYVRILDNLYTQQTTDIEPNIEIMLGVLREFLSQFTEDCIGI
jgi:nitrate/nitrite-specific signal transduction histidine kinase